MPEHVILRLEGPLQAWGDVALDPRRPTLPFPSRSALAGLLANALGWRYRDGERTTALQDSLRFAVREDVQPRLIDDFQTADLSADDPTRPYPKDPGWSAWGREAHGGGTQILRKQYLADGSFCVALVLTDSAPVTVAELSAALRRPARPLCLGRKCCPPSRPILDPIGTVEAATPFSALLLVPPTPRRLVAGQLRCWYEATARTTDPTMELWDRRNFRSNRFTGSRRVAQVRIDAATLPAETRP